MQVHLKQLALATSSRKGRNALAPRVLRQATRQHPLPSNGLHHKPETAISKPTFNIRRIAIHKGHNPFLSLHTESQKHSRVLPSIPSPAPTPWPGIHHVATTPGRNLGIETETGTGIATAIANENASDAAAATAQLTVLGSFSLQSPGHREIALPRARVQGR